MISISNQFLFDNSKKGKCMIFLNIDVNSKLFRYLWSTTEVHITADGAANRLFTMFSEDRDLFIPDYIMGDFDSANEEVLEYYQNKGTTLLKDPNQDNTDLDKCLLHLHERLSDIKVIVYGDLGGRFDHCFGILNSLMIARDYFNDLVLVGPKATLRVLPAGSYSIQRFNELASHDTCTCGIIPLGGWLCEHVTTTGFKWNLDDSTMQFGGIVSSSNCMLGDSATINSPYPFVWTLSTHWDLLIVCLRFEKITFLQNCDPHLFFIDS